MTILRETYLPEYTSWFLAKKWWRHDNCNGSVRLLENRNRTLWRFSADP